MGRHLFPQPQESSRHWQGTLFKCRQKVICRAVAVGIVVEFDRRDKRECWVNTVGTRVVDALLLEVGSGNEGACCVTLGLACCFHCVHSELERELIGNCHMLGACEPLPATLQHLALLCRSAAQGIHQPTSSETNTKESPCCQPGGTHTGQVALPGHAPVLRTRKVQARHIRESYREREEIPIGTGWSWRGGDVGEGGMGIQLLQQPC